MTREIRLPEISENVDSGEVIEVLVSEGDTIDKDQSIVELETEKAAFEVPSPLGGKVTEIAVKKGDTIRVGQVILKIETQEREDREKEESTQEKKPSETTAPRKPGEAMRAEETAAIASKESAPAQEPLPASPAVRRKARELGVDLRELEGTGPGGRILAEDVEKRAKQIITSSQGTPTGARTGAPLPDFSRWGETEAKPMSGVRRVTAENVFRAWVSVPHVTQFDRADVTELERFRKKYAKRVEDAGGKLTVTSILLKVCASALKRFPRFNASLDMEKKEIVYKKYIHIGVAVDTERGLLVPVIRHADQKGILELSVELTELAEKTRGKKITPDELQGGNFTISNLGGIGGENFSPIVYAPQVAILGVSRARMEPVYTGDNFAPRLMLPLALSYDHRIIDGADGIRFIRWIAETLENPLMLVFEGGE